MLYSLKLHLHLLFCSVQAEDYFLFGARIAFKINHFLDESLVWFESIACSLSEFVPFLLGLFLLLDSLFDDP